MEKCLCSTQILWRGAAAPLHVSCSVRVTFTPTQNTLQASVSKPQNLTWRNQLSNTARNVLSQAQGPLSCGRHKRCFVWVEDSGIQPRSLFDVLEAFNVPFSPRLSHFTCQRAHSLCSCPSLTSYQVLLILCTMSEQCGTLVSITRCFLASSETSGPTRWGSACELLFVASGCFHSERGHCHRPKVVIYQHRFEATV